MDWISYQSLAGVAVVLSAGALWGVMELRKHLHMEELIPTRKWKKAINGSRHTPVHQPDQVPEHADDDARRFYRDFAPVADLLNLWNKESPWSFENTGKLESQYRESGAERKIEIRYNQQRTGTIRMSCSRYGHKSFGEICFHLDLQNGRFFEGSDVFGLASSLASIVGDTPEGIRETKTNMMLAMINAMWQVGEKAFGNPSLEFEARGKAEWYLNEWLPKHSTPH